MIERIRSFLADYGIRFSNGAVYIGEEPTDVHDIQHGFYSVKTEMPESGTFPEYFDKDDVDRISAELTTLSDGHGNEEYIINHYLFNTLDSEFDNIGDTVTTETEHGDSEDIIIVCNKIGVSELHELTHWALTDDEEDAVTADHWVNWTRVLWNDVVNHIADADLVYETTDGGVQNE